MKAGLQGGTTLAKQEVPSSASCVLSESEPSDHHALRELPVTRMRKLRPDLLRTRLVLSLFWFPR